MSISEANYDIHSNLKINENNIEYTDMGVGYGISRQVLLLHKSLQYIRRKDMEDKLLSIVICQIKLSKNRHFNVIAHYRQWQLPHELLSYDIKYNSQQFRYTRTIDIFSNLLADGSNTVIIG